MGDAAGVVCVEVFRARVRGAGVCRGGSCEGGFAGAGEVGEGAGRWGVRWVWRSRVKEVGILYCTGVARVGIQGSQSRLVKSI